MPRDKKIKKIFEIADDGIQGVVGYFFYVLACKNAVNANSLLSKLPDKVIPITHEWSRYYNPHDLIDIMNSLFNPYHARICLISTISIFEGALKNFIERLLDANKIKQSPKNSYKKKLEWIFREVLKSNYGTATMIARIPELCLHIDHARRIRNLWMHNNGLFDEHYKKDGILLPKYSPIIDVSYKNKKPVIIKPEWFLAMCHSHIELLHQIHYQLQKKYFGQKKSYSYKELKKRIEWHRLLTGV